MGKEIERKYLVKLDAWTPEGAGIHFKQGYLNSQKERVVRVRIEGAKAKLTIKGITKGVTRSEFEYTIPVEDAGLLLDNLCEQPLIDKHRHKEEHQILGSILRGESLEHFETLRQTKDGRLIDVSITASPIKDAVGKAIGVSKVVRDISTRKKADQHLRCGEARRRGNRTTTLRDQSASCRGWSAMA